jgi:hypothetical protein
MKDLLFNLRNPRILLKQYGITFLPAPCQVHLLKATKMQNRGSEQKSRSCCENNDREREYTNRKRLDFRLTGKRRREHAAQEPAPRVDKFSVIEEASSADFWDKLYLPFLI